MPSGIKHTKETWISAVFAKLPNNKNLYYYNDINFVNIRTKIDIFCIACKQNFSQRPDHHLAGQGCRKCISIAKSKAHSKFEKQANIIHKDKYTYLSFYENCRKKIQIQCKTCTNIFFQIPNNHLNGRGCPKCAISEQTKSHIQFVKEANIIHNNAYIYLSNYENRKKKIKIQCKAEKHLFFQSPYNHLYGNGCPKCCAGSISKASQKWLDWKEKTENISLLREHRIKLHNKTIVIDGFDTITNTVYEFHGDFWHGNPKRFDPEKKNAFNKKTFGELFLETTKRSALIRNAGYNLVSIWESEWEEIEKNLLLKQTA